MSVVNGNLHQGQNSTSKEDFEEIHVPVPWGHIAGKWWGPKDVQPIIAIHGWQDNCGTFDNLAPLLRNRGHSLFCIDLPGHGFSSHLPPGQSYYIWWDGIHFLRRVVKYFKWKDIVILGHSLGGGIAFLYAAVYPGEVRKYVSIDLASPSVRDVKKGCDVIGFAIDKVLAYEHHKPESVPCYEYDEMLNILEDAHKGSVNRQGCEILLKRGMRPAENKKDHYYYTRDARLKFAALGAISLEQVMELASRITCEVRLKWKGKWWGPKDVQPIIAIHGWQDNCGTFDNLAPLLRNRGHSLFCIDLPGHGFSSHLPPGQSYYIWWDGIHFLRRVVKYFKWKDIVILGHSLGGGIAFLYAAVYPGEVRKYVSIDLASPSVRDVKKGCDVIGFAIDKVLAYEHHKPESVPCYEYDEMLNILEDAHKGSVNRQGCEILLKRGMRPAENKKDHYYYTRDARLKFAALGAISLEQVMELASRITCEVMNVRAKPGLKFDVPEHYDMVLDQIEKQAKKVERHVVEGTHHLQLNDAESINDIIHNFLVS